MVKDEVGKKGEDKNGNNQQGHDHQGVKSRFFKLEMHVVQENQNGLDQRDEEDQENGGAFGEKNASSDGEEDEANEP